MPIIKKHHSQIVFAAVLLALLFAVAFLFGSNYEVLAQSPDYGGSYAANVGLSTEDLRVSVIRVIRNVLGVLGILAVGLMIYAGALWMTSRGDEQTVDKAKKTLVNVVIGFIIIAMAFTIVQYIFTILSGGGSGGGGGGGCTPGVCSGCSRCATDGVSYNFDDSCAPGCIYISPPAQRFRIDSFNTAHAGTDPKQDVYTCSKVQTIFNNDIYSQSVIDSSNSGRLQIESNGAVEGGTWEVRGNVLTFTPNGNVFANISSSYTDHIPDIIVNTAATPRQLSECSLSAGCDLLPPPEAAWNFNVSDQGDIEDPYISGSYPRNDPTNIDKFVSRDPVLEVNFSESVDGNTVLDVNGISPYPGNIYLNKVNDDGSIGTQISNAMLNVDFYGTGFRIYLTPPNLLESFERYQITVQNIEDLCGNTMAPTSVSWQFETSDQIPGISSVYPTGDNICSNTHVIASFNTSMYYQEVEIDVYDGAGYTAHFTLPSGVDAVTSTFGEFRVADVGNPGDPGYVLADHYKVYEFIPSSDFDENTRYSVLINTDKVINFDSDILTGNWDFRVTDIQNCVCTPYVSHLSKSRGPVGECITVYGSCFRGTREQSATISSLTFEGTDATVGSGYTDNAIGTTVPASFSAGDSPQVVVAIDYASGNTIPPSSQDVRFYIESGAADGPCLWSVSPNEGPRGTSLTLNGTRFGDTSSTRQIIFAGGGYFNVSNAINWKNDQITNVIVPASTIDGEVRVINDVGTSNGMPFNVHACLGDGDLDPGEECDGTNLGGLTCSDFGFAGGTLFCSSACKVDTSSCSNDPRILEDGSCTLSCFGGPNDSQNCFSDSECSGNPCNVSKVPSPNPRPDTNEVCLNTVISADFNTDISASSINSNNIFIHKCDDSNCNSVDPSPLVFSVIPSGSRSFRLNPSGNLSPSTTYQVTVLGGVNSEGSPVGVTSDTGIAMKDTYTWHFTTANSGLCPLDKVFIDPNWNELGAGSSDSNYSATGVAPYLSTNCILIDSTNYDWSWNVVDNNSPTIGVTVSEDLTDDSNAIVTTGTTAGEVDVTAAAEGKTGYAHLKVTSESCAFNPGVCADPNQDGVEECSGSVCDIDLDRCTPIIKSLSPKSGPLGRAVTVNGCHFKSKTALSKVDFGTTPVSNYPCGEYWTDTQIIVEVPSTLATNSSYPVMVTDQSGLTSNIMSFNATANCSPGYTGLIPTLCSLSPDHGQPGNPVSLNGENLGSAIGQVTFSGVTAVVDPPTNWTDKTIQTSVPSITTSGNVIATQNSCESNGLYFTLDSGDVGDPCDGDTDTPICDPDNSQCWPGLFCDPSLSCTCQPVPEARVIYNSLSPRLNNSTSCRNTVMIGTFDQKMNHGSINSSSIQLWEKVGSTKPSDRFCVEEDKLISKNDDKPSFWKKIKSFVRSIWSKTVFASPGDIWCKINGSVSAQDIADGTNSCTNPEGCTSFTFSPYRPLVGSLEYQGTIIGGDSGVKTVLGGKLYTASYSQQLGDHYKWFFNLTGNKVCLLDHVNVDITMMTETSGGSAPYIREDTTYDYFSCAGRDDCVDDTSSTSGNQHTYHAQAYDKFDVPLSASYEWKESTDPDNIIDISGALDVVDIDITANPENGKASVMVTASDANTGDDIEYGEAHNSITVTNFLCRNPWPSLTGFPYEDADANCNVGSYSCNYDFDFSFYYCRDYGNDENWCDGGYNEGLYCDTDSDCPSGTCRLYTDDDLPEPVILNIKGTDAGYCVGGIDHANSCTSDSNCPGGFCNNPLKSIMLVYEEQRCADSNLPCFGSADCGGEACEINNDSIGMLVYNNGEHLSPSAWYEKYVNNQGGYFEKTVDSYAAISGGRTNYINFAVDSGTSIYTDMLLVSYTDNFKPVTLNIYDQIIDSIKFNTSGNVTNIQVCTDGTDYSGFCSKDSDCPSGWTCDAEKEKLARDVIRVGSIGEMGYHLALYRGKCSQNNNLACITDSDCPFNTDPDNPEFCITNNTTYPLLQSGTYIQGQSVSVWDSWGTTFAGLLGTSLLEDPLNEIADCGVGYNDECWNKDVLNTVTGSQGDFQCNSGSHMYHYEVTGGGSGYNIYANLEHSNRNWGGNFTTVSSSPCSPGTYNIRYVK